MAKYTKQADGTLVTTDSGFIDDVTAGLSLLTLKDGEYLDGKSAMYGLGIYGTGIVALTSIFTRKRAAEGKKPMAGVFF